MREFLAQEKIATRFFPNSLARFRADSATSITRSGVLPCCGHPATPTEMVERIIARHAGNDRLDLDGRDRATEADDEVDFAVADDHVASHDHPTPSRQETSSHILTEATEPAPMVGIRQS